MYIGKDRGGVAAATGLGVRSEEGSMKGFKGRFGVGV